MHIVLVLTFQNFLMDIFFIENQTEVYWAGLSHTDRFENDLLMMQLKYIGFIQFD